MKTAIKLRMGILALAALILFSCGNRMTGSAADNTGTNGATNGTGKVPKSDKVHNYKN
jgi:hypothetical protein